MFMDRLDLVFFGLNAMSILLIITTFDISFKGLHLYQGPKLTLLGKRQLATEIFLFSRQLEKCGGQKVLNTIFPLQQNSNRWKNSGRKFFLLRIRPKRIGFGPNCDFSANE